MSNFNAKRDRMFEFFDSKGLIEKPEIFMGRRNNDLFLSQRISIV